MTPASAISRHGLGRQLRSWRGIPKMKHRQVITLARSSRCLHSHRPPSKELLLQDALVRQDPYRRVQFLPQVVTVMQALARFPNARNIESHLVPFWSVSYICDHSLSTRARKLGESPVEITRRFCSEIGCAIAAVSSEHWCSGLVLRDNIPLVAGTMRNERFRPASTLDRYAGFNGSENWNSSSIPLFKYSYPKLNEIEGERLSALQTNPGDLLEMVREPVTYAVPTYRVGYKIELEDGIAYVDSYFDNPAHRLSQRRPGDASWISVIDLQSCFAFSQQQYTDDEPSGSIASFPLKPISRNVIFMEILLEAMKRSPIDWEDPHIFPADGRQGKSASILSEYRAKQVLGRWYPPPPLYFVPKKIARLKPTPPPPSPVGPSHTGQAAVATPASIKVEISGRTLKERRRALTLARIRITRERIQMAAEAAIPLPPPTQTPTIHDYKGWYELFGVRPDVDYLQPNCHEDVTQRLKKNRIILALQYHRDQGGCDKKMTQLNVAWDQLKEVEGRIKYHEKKI